MKGDYIEKTPTGMLINYASFPFSQYDRNSQILYKYNNMKLQYRRCFAEQGLNLLDICVVFCVCVYDPMIYGNPARNVLLFFTLNQYVSLIQMTEGTV